MALDDALALGLALNHAFSSGTSTPIQKAFELFDQTRRPHATRLLKIVHDQINKKAPAYATLEEEDRALIARFRGRPDLEWLSEHDVEKALLNVITDAEKLVKAEDLPGGLSTEATREERSYESRL